MASYEPHVGSDAELRDRAQAVRRRVFIAEQGVSEAVEMDGEDANATHVVLSGDDGAVATARLRFPGETTVKIERVAVLPAYRGDGLGRQVMAVAEGHARNQGATTARLHAQLRVLEFYERLGYDSDGDTFDEAGIPHVEMSKPLTG